MSEKKKYKKGVFFALGIAIGLPLGFPIAIALDNIALGPALGLPFGIAIGIAMELTMNKDAEPLTKEEKRKRLFWAMGLMMVGLLVFSALLLRRL